MLDETLAAFGERVAGISAAEALGRAPLEPLQRTALTRRLEGTYTVELAHMSAAWLASASLRAGDALAEEPSARLAAGNDALALALARTLDGRLRLGSPVRTLIEEDDGVTLRAGELDAERYDRAVLALPLPLALAVVPALRARAGYARAGFGIASKLHVQLAAPVAPAGVQALEAAFWTWTARDAASALSTLAASFAGGAQAHEALAVAAGPDAWLGALRALRPELMPIDEPVLTRWGDDALAGRCTRATRRAGPRGDDEDMAAPHGRIHLAGEHTAAEFSGTLEGALRSGARAADEVIAQR